MNGRFSRKRQRKQRDLQRHKAIGSIDDTIKHIEAMIATLNNEPKKDKS